MESSRLPQNCQYGFTLIELITVMLIVGVMAVVVLPRFDLLRGYDEIGFRDKVRATLEYARKSAVAQRRFVCVVIDNNDLTLTIESVIPEDPAHTGVCPYTRLLALPAPDRGCGAGVTNKICNPAGVTLAPAATVQFDPLGRATLGAGTYTIRGDSDTSITVIAETGYVQ